MALMSSRSKRPVPAAGAGNSAGDQTAHFVVAEQIIVLNDLFR
jgi:hypothetical protein